MRRLRRATEQGCEEGQQGKQQSTTQTQAPQSLVQSTQRLLARLKNDVRFSQQDQSQGESFVPKAARKRRKIKKVKNSNKLFKNDQNLEDSDSSPILEQLPCQVNYNLCSTQVPSKVRLDQIFKRVQSIQKQQEIIKFVKKQKDELTSPEPSPSKEELKLIAPKDHRNVFRNIIFIQEGKKARQEKVVLKRSTSREDFDAQLQRSLMGEVQVEKYLKNIERKTRFSAVKQPQGKISQLKLEQSKPQIQNQLSHKQPQLPLVPTPSLQVPSLPQRKQPRPRQLKKAPKLKGRRSRKPRPSGEGFCKYFQQQAEMSDDHSSQGYQSQGEQELKDLIDNSCSNGSSGVKRQFVEQEQARHQLQVQRMLKRIQARKFEPQYSTDSNDSIEIPKHVPKSLKQQEEQSVSESSQEELPAKQKKKVPVRVVEPSSIFKQGIERAVKQTRVKAQIAKNSILQSRGCKTYIGL